MDLYTGWIRCEKQVNLEMLYRPLWFNPKVVSRVGAKNPFSSFYLHTLHALWLFNRTRTTGLMIHNVVFQHVALNKMQMLLKIIYFHLVFEETWCWAVQPVTRFRERLLCVCEDGGRPTSGLSSSARVRVVNGKIYSTRSLGKGLENRATLRSDASAIRTILFFFFSFSLIRW